MKVLEIGGNLGKEVLYAIPGSVRISSYLLNAYIFRVDPRNKKKRLTQVELQDLNCPHSVIIARPDDIILKNK